MTDQRYVTFGVPVFEKKEVRHGLLRKILSKFKVYEDCSSPLWAAPMDGQCEERDSVTTEQFQDNKTSMGALQTPGSSEDHNGKQNQRMNNTLKYFNITSQLTSMVGGPTNPKMAADRRYWMLDQSCPYCFECGCRFTALRRKHHCRVCGRIFCHQCSRQLIEGRYIGMTGLQRSCNYCAYTLLSLTNQANALQNPRKQSVTQISSSGGKSHLGGYRSMSENSLSESASPETPPKNDIWNKISQHAAIAGTSTNRKSGDNLTESILREPSPESVDLFPCNSLPPRFGRRLSTPLVVSSRYGTHDSSGSAGCSQWAELMNSRLSSTNPDAGHMAMDSPSVPQIRCQCVLAEHVHADLSDQIIHSLWSRMIDGPIERGVEATGYPSNSKNDQHHTRNLIELFDFRSGSTKLQVVPVAGAFPTRFCAPGFSLVYWLVSNIPELNSCRSKARSVCQKFMDFDLLVDLLNPGRRIFRDDFTPYELKQLSPNIPQRSKAGRRISCPAISFSRSSNLRRQTVDEPEWLRGIAGSSRDVTKNSYSHPIYTLDSDDGGSSSSEPSQSTPADSATKDDKSSCGKSDMKESSSPDSSKIEDGTQSIADPDTTSVFDSVRASNEISTGSTSECHKNVSVISSSDTVLPSQGLLSIVPKYRELTESMRNIFDDYVNRFVLQEVRDNNLDKSWALALVDLAQRVCRLVKFDLRSGGVRGFPPGQTAASNIEGNDRDASSSVPAATAAPRHAYSPMDIRYYVHMKKLTDGTKADSEIFPGVIFTKRPTHKFMPTNLHKPRILLLATCVEYQRAPVRLTYLESQIMQEEEYLSNCVSKLLSLHPNVIFVSGTVSHFAQTLILKAGIALFCNVKRPVLLRIARITGADVVESVDRLVSENTIKSGRSGNTTFRRPVTQLGTCQQFSTQKVLLVDGAVKYLVRIENPSKEVVSSNSVFPRAPSRPTTVEATVILRGDDISVLKRAKRCFLFALYLCYNARLEMSLNRDCFIYRADPKPVLSIPEPPPVDDVSESGLSLNSSSKRDSGNNDPASASVVPPSELAEFLDDRLFSPSPSVEVTLPFLASAEGQLVPLQAYYTYVVEWPFGRKLNDLLKRKMKVLKSEMYALKHEASSVCKRKRFPELVDDKHPFLRTNLKVYRSRFFDALAASRPKRPLNRSPTTNSGSNAELLMSGELNSVDEAFYTDFKARANVLSVDSTSADQVYSRVWAGSGNLASKCWTIFLDDNDGGVSEVAQNRARASANESENFSRLKRSILDPRSHQSLSFLTTLFTPKSFMWPEPCVPSWIASVDFYGAQDLPIGLFLEKFCFTPQHCRHPHCEVLMVEHVQRFVQTSGSVELTTRKLPHSLAHTAVSLSDKEQRNFRRDSRIQMWSTCRFCQSCSPPVFMSGDSWHFSFVKFLDSIINTPVDWGRCVLQAANVPNVVSAKSNECTLISDKSILNQAAEGWCPDLSTKCLHSAYKSLEYCFALEHKVAVFRYRPVTVFEVVMPPNEIRTYYAHSAKPDVDPSSSTLQTCGSSVASGTPVNEGKTQERGDSQPPAASVIPSYLYTEAIDTLGKYYRIYASVKSYIVTLQHENTNAELSSALNSLVSLLQNDSRRNHMEFRAELLAYLLHPGTETQKTDENPFVYNQKPEQKSPLPLAANGSSASSNLKASTDSLSKLYQRSVSYPSDTPPKNVLPSAQMKEADANNAPKEQECRLNAPTADAPLNWKALVSSLEPAEKCFMVQDLMNELKRWVYSFVVDWNSKCAGFESLSKRSEKIPKELRRKPTSHNIARGIRTPSPSNRLNASASAFIVPETPGLFKSIADVSAGHGVSGSGPNSKIPPFTSHTNPADVSSNTKTPATSLNLFKDSFHVSVPERLEQYKLTPEPTDSEYDLNPSATIDLNRADLNASCPALKKLRLRKSGPPISEKESAFDESHTCNSVDAILPNEPKVPPVFFGIWEDEPPKDGDKKNYPKASEPGRLATTLDPLSLKAIYSTTELDNPTTVHSPSVRKISTAAACAATIPLTAPSGMRRFIHALLPSNSDFKVFEDPFPPNEHPQLNLADDPNLATMRRTQHLFNSVQKAEVGGNSSVASQCMYNLVQTLRFAPPDVYVNDNELTSIVAYALSTSDYERHLVDLHSNSSQSNRPSSVQIGQPALSDSGSPSKTPSEQPSPTSSRSVKTHGSVIETERSSVHHSTRSSVLSTCSADAPPSPAPKRPSANGSQPVPTTEKSGPSPSRHIKIQFSDSSTNFFCCVYYASEFFRLRQLSLPQGDTGFIRSLSRCFHWDARGGKSGSLFMKTRDERFIVKELSSIEMKTFHEIAQQYFDYLIGAALEQRLCVLSRIVGIFHVGFKNSVSGYAHRFDVLVMENLLHGRNKLAFIYDLKGSLRKRLVDETDACKDSTESTGSHSNVEGPGGANLSTNQSTDAAVFNSVDTNLDAHGPQTQPARKRVPVLLDQNLLNASIDNPLYLRVHSKNALSHCLQVDTAFLANLFIMDYSLLVGVDLTTNELVLGLIDYMRKFTLDKKLEMIIKQTITSARGPIPTILTPDLYRERFLLQMDTYFPVVPDHWYDSLAEHAEAWHNATTKQPPSQCNQTSKTASTQTANDEP
ncbi:unnamed protein product [Calicophoron daubneyi]|uniref:1-phosphatidylinositol-3-phosphate 5-kinase n=1 Tax=Calicophoron daubneyi TaxID=300641 RepID=A0AAV2TZ13_CALDB